MKASLQREIDIQIVLFLNVGFGSKFELDLAYKHSRIINGDLILFGFVANFKSLFGYPSKSSSS